MELFEKQVYISRRKKLIQKGLKGIALFIGNTESPMNYPSNGYHFRQDSNFSYFFGLDIPNMIGVIDFDEGKEIIFANDVDIDDIIWMGPQPSIKELAAKVGVELSFSLNEFENYISKVKNQNRKIHFTPPYRAESKIMINSWLGINFQNMKSTASVELIKAIVDLRSVKEPCEIEELEIAAKIGYEMHMAAFKHAKAGVKEQEIYGIMEGISYMYGKGPSFPIILSIHGETLHNHNHSNILKNGDLLLVDAGAQNNKYYSSDYTRTMPVDGIFSEKQKNIYQIVLDANNKALSLAKPEVTYQSIHLDVCKVITDGLKQVGLMKGDTNEAVAAGAHALFLPHGLGHMMGLDVHDMEDFGEDYVGYDDDVKRINQFGTSSLRMGRRLKPGFVVTDEPGIYFIPELIDKWKSEKLFEEFINYNELEKYRDFGGIRLEDDILVTETGARFLGGKRLPITIEEVEEIIKNN